MSESPFKMRGFSGFKSPSPLTNTLRQQKLKRNYTKSQMAKAFGEGVSSREGAKALGTSTYTYNRMKRDWTRSQNRKNKKTTSSITAKAPKVTSVTGGTDSKWMIGKTGNKIRVVKNPPKA